MHLSPVLRIFFSQPPHPPPHRTPPPPPLLFFPQCPPPFSSFSGWPLFRSNRKYSSCELREGHKFLFRLEYHQLRVSTSTPAHVGGGLNLLYKDFTCRRRDSS